MAWLTINYMCNLLEQFNLNSPSAAFEAISGMEGWQTADPDPGPTPVATHVVTNHHRTTSVALAVQILCMLCIVTSAPVGNEH